MSFLSFCLFILLFFSYRSLSQRVEQLEQQLRSGRPKEPVRPADAPQDAAVTQPIAASAVPLRLDTMEPVSAPPREMSEMSENQPPSRFTPQATEPDTFFLYEWFKEQTLIKIGAIIFFLGAAWFVGYAIEQDWISPLTRILFGLGGALVVYGLGYWRSQADLVQSQVLTVLGTGILLGTVAASQFAFVVPVLPGPLALALMVAGVGYTGFVALKTKTEWLAIVAVAAGLLSPILIATEIPDSLLLLSYLLCLTVGFLVAAAATLWRYVVLSLVLGVSFYVAALHGGMSDLTLWIFVCIFSTLFTASVSASILRATRIDITDVVTLGATLLLFLVSAYEMTFATATPLFVASLVFASVAYLFRARNISVDAVSLYALISVALMFMGTSSLFSGVTLTVILSVQALLLLIGSCYAATVQRSVYVAAATFALPLMNGLSDLSSSLWRDGIWHVGLFGVVVLLLMLGGAVVWLIEQPALRQLSWIRTIAATLLSAWFVYMWIAVDTISDAYNGADATIGFIYLSLIAAILVTTYVGMRVPSGGWRTWIILSWIPPIAVALSTFSASVWNTGIVHPTFAVTSGVVLALVYLTLFYTYLAKFVPLGEHDADNSYGALWLTLGYVFIWLHNVWYALYPDAVASVAQYVSYFMVIAIVVSALLLLRIRFRWTLSILGLGILPLLLSIESFELTGWSDGALGLSALGVYASTTLILVLAQSLGAYVGRPEETELIKGTRKVLFSLGGLQAFILVWILTHTLAATSTMAVAIALFIYTVTGLAAYSYGRASGHLAAKRVGVLLLGAVVLRLGLVDVWSMEIIWRIVTFLSIGTLFILTALLERSGSKR